MDVLSGVASGAAFFSLLKECGQSLRHLYENIQTAKKEVNLLMGEVSNCQDLFDIFDRISSPTGDRVTQLAHKKGMAKTLLAQADLACEQIDRITLRLEPLRKDSDASPFDQLRAKVRWHFTKDEVQFPMAALSSVKQSLTLLSSLLALDHWNMACSNASMANTEQQSILLSRR